MSNEGIVSAFIRFAESEKDSAEYETNFWAYDELSGKTFDNPHEALLLILAVASRTQVPKVIELLAAGPLEDLLVENGRVVIDEIERHASSNSAIAELLGGVWKSEMDQDVWKRVEKARARKW